MQSEPFDAMIMHYCVNVLDRVMPHFDSKQKKVLDQYGKQLQEGPDFENPHYKGFLMVYDGEEILIEVSDLVLRKKKIGAPTDVHNLEGLVKFMQDNIDKADMKVILNSKNYIAYSMKGEFKNHYPGYEDAEETLANSLPKDFYSLDGHIPVTDAGTKTHAGVLIPKMGKKAIEKLVAEGKLPESKKDESVETIILNNSPVGIGMGRLSHFDSYGMAEDFHFIYDDQLECVQGAYRQRNEQGKMAAAENQTVKILNKRIFNKYGIIRSRQPDNQSEEKTLGSYRLPDNKEKSDLACA
jgi:hypothetical protein